MNRITGTDEKMLSNYLTGLWAFRKMTAPDNKQVIHLPLDSTLPARQEFDALLKHDGFWVWTSNPDEPVSENTNLLSVLKTPPESSSKNSMESEYDFSGQHWMAQGEFLDFVCSTYGGTPWQKGQDDWKKLGEFSLMIWNGCLLNSGVVFLNQSQNSPDGNYPVFPLNEVSKPVYIQEPVLRDFFLNLVIPRYFPHGREKESSYQAFLKRQEKRWDRHWKKAHPEWKNQNR